MGDVEMKTDGDRIEELVQALEVESNRGSAFEGRLRRMEENLRTAMTLQDELMDVLNRCDISIAELVQWRDTGAVHKRCKTCEQFLPVTHSGHFPLHWGRLGRCLNSNGEA